MAAAVILPTSVTPANAVGPAVNAVTPAAVAVDPATIAAAIKAAYDLYKQFTGGGLSLADATKQIIAAINTAKTDIISHIDRVAVADARACTEKAVIDFADIEHFNPDTLQAFALDTTGCVTQIESLLTAVTDKGAIDQLGFALNTAGPLALVARSRAGFTNDGLLGVLRSGDNAVIPLLEPSCYMDPEPLEGNRFLLTLTCDAYNGETGLAFLPGTFRPPFPPVTAYPTQLHNAQVGATRNTSRPVATLALTQLP